MALQFVELHFAREPQIDFAAIKARAEAILGEDLGSPELKGAMDSFVYFHTSHLVEYAEGKIPAQTAILRCHQPIDLSRYQDVLQQSWACPDAATMLAPSQHSIALCELMTQLLEPIDRVTLFHGVLQAAVEATNPDALVFKHSQQVVRPAEYLAAAAEQPAVRPGSLNVRSFNVSNADGDRLMDTRGLHEIGLHDLQCHFRGLDPNDVAQVLFNSAVYIFENGDVIESGHTIAGVGPAPKWLCQFEDSLAPPEREVLDLNPGFPYAAGGRR